MGWSRRGAIGAALGAGCLLLAAGVGPGAPARRSPGVHGGPGETRHQGLAPASPGGRVATPNARPAPGPAREAHVAAEGLPGPAGAPAGSGDPSPWWLESGPKLEVRIGDHAVSATAARLDPAALDGVEAGDRIRLALPEVGTLDVVVRRVASPGPAIRLLQGHLADPAGEYPATLTLGPRFAFANVTTPTGVWMAEFEDGAGWVLYDDLEHRLVDHGLSDERIPPHDGGAG